MVETSEMCGACGSYSVPKRARFCPNCGARQENSDNDALNDDVVPMVPAVPIGNTVSAGSNSSQNTTEAPPVHVTGVSVAESATPAPTTPTRAGASTNTSTNTLSRENPGRQTMNDTPTIPSSTTTATAVPSEQPVRSGTTVTHSSRAEATHDVPTYTKPNFGSDNDHDNVYGSHQSGNTDYTSTMAMFWKNPTEVMLERASNYSPMGGILFIGLAGRTKGKFTLPKTIHCGQILTGNKLDLSIADFVHPVTTILVGTILGGFKLIVPRGVRVETNGLGILGGFKGLRSQTVHAGEVDNAPLIILQGAAILGGAKVVVNDSVPPVRVIA